MATPESFNAPSRLLLGPGPSPVAPSVLTAMGKPLIGHLDPRFLDLMNETQEMLRTLFGTTNKLTFPVSGTGSSGMEICFANLVQPEDTVLVFTNGVFGGRMAALAQNLQAEVVEERKEWGKVFSISEIESAISRVNPDVIAIVHAETSTGALQPMDGIGALARKHDAVLVVDCVTSLGGVPVEIDNWKVDAAFSGTQKCLSCPPGLAPVTFGNRALDKIKARSSSVRSWYFDLSLIMAYWDFGASKRAYHHTAPVSMIYGLHEALRLVLEGGLPAAFGRHKAVHEQLKSGLTQRGFEYASDPAHSLPQLNAVKIPEKISDKDRSRLLEEFGIEVGGGLGQAAGSLWRIGMMGYGARDENVSRLLDALDQL